jgi:hypothetical protein
MQEALEGAGGDGLGDAAGDADGDLSDRFHAGLVSQGDEFTITRGVDADGDFEGDVPSVTLVINTNSVKFTVQGVGDIHVFDGQEAVDVVQQFGLAHELDAMAKERVLLNLCEHPGVQCQRYFVREVVGNVKVPLGNARSSSDRPLTPPPLIQVQLGGHSHSISVANVDEPLELATRFCQVHSCWEHVPSIAKRVRVLQQRSTRQLQPVPVDPEGSMFIYSVSDKHSDGNKERGGAANVAAAAALAAAAGLAGGGLADALPSDQAGAPLQLGHFSRRRAKEAAFQAGWADLESGLPMLNTGGRWERK